MCNEKGAVTPHPHPTTPGSGLDCYYGFLGLHDKVNNYKTKIIFESFFIRAAQNIGFFIIKYIKFGRHRQCWFD